MRQTKEGELPFDQLPKGAQNVQIFDNMHSPLLSAGKTVQNGCQLVFDKSNAHILSGNTRTKINNIIKTAEEE